MRYPLCNRARLGTWQSHMKAVLPGSWPSNSKRMHALWVGRTGPRVSGQLKCGFKSRDIVRVPCPKKSQGAKPPFARYHWDSNSGTPGYKT
ncbi:hypothetical protein M9458_030041, partial [Cirrhinus mrigala]